MRRVKFVSMFALLVLLLGGILPVVKAEAEIEVARESAGSFIAKAVRSFPEWEGATPMDAQIYHDLNGQTSAYMFTVSKDRESLGRIVVGGPEYEFRVLEGGNANPPMLPGRSELEKVLRRDQGIQLRQGEALGKPMLVYLGYDHYVAVYEVRGHAMAFELRNRYIAPTSEFTRPQRETEGDKSGARSRPLRRKVEATTATEGTDYKNLAVPNLLMDDPAIPPDMRNNDNCGPTSGAMVVQYYRMSKGYQLFDAWPNDHNHLYNSMDTNSWGGPGTSPDRAGPGWTEYASSKGYNFGSYSASPESALDWWNIMVGRINEDRPFLVMFWWDAPAYQWHWTTIRGYANWATKYAIVNNCWGAEDYVNIYANYDQVTLVQLWSY